MKWTMATFWGVLMAMLCLAVSLPGAAQTSCGAPPKAQPHRIKGGESFPPLPLPVTPLRRTERKRPPAPPVLIGKLAYGEERTGRREDGSTYTYLDWRSDPADASSLLQFAGPKLGINYRAQVVRAEEFSWDPSQNPILYITGHQRFSVPSWAVERVRGFVLAGGTVIADACCGSAPFADGFEDFIKQAFPHRRLALLPAEHPVFHCFFDIDTVAFMEGAETVDTRPPELLGIEIGCRAGVLFTRHDLSCGWDGHIHDKGARIEPHDAVRLGTNMLAYTLANQSLGRFLSITKTYHEEGTAVGADEFVFGQLIHQGDWDPDPSAAANLLKAVNANSAIDVKFVRHDVEAGSAGLFEAPFLYMTGHHDFGWSEAEVRNLRSYLTSGGFLLADACCGRAAFDEAFRREMARVFPDRALEPIPLDDPFFSALYRIETVRHTLRPEPGPPQLFGVKVDGYYVAVYSPADLGNGWEGEEHPFIDGLSKEDSLRLGMNAIMYALTH